ncbi:hypothetical protein EV193_104351 [Herbihabitans rhizosphaerae]|uniref:Uncharacterized protein n=1 Tax=Herbihabitans rhizosphaerae TaxID=1872711 RepID=A0A4Q7KRF7_9PSEU|nr:hypothetical protein [Herbihabitans rhizosphaerae]RZS39135.1 hypothetical protein EV193_104351 [Herbihabitans rhizosphaerae]
MTTKGEPTEEVIALAVEIVDGWYQDRRVDWEDVWERLDGAEMEDGTKLDLGDDLLSPYLGALRREVQRIRREG